MNTAQPFYLMKLKEDLSQKQRQNPQFSMRGYARYLGVHPATLSQVFKGTRGLPLKTAQTVLGKLKLGPKEKTLFMESLLGEKISLDRIKIDFQDECLMLDDSFYKTIAEWEHYAVLELFKLRDFSYSVEQVVARLGISDNRAEVVVNNLLQCGLLGKEANGNICKVHSDVRTTEDIENQAIQESHKETLNIGLKKLEEIELEMRDFSSSTLAIDLNMLPEAKAIIREFRRKMTKLLRSGDKTDVFQLAIQFYPLTKTNNNKNKKEAIL